jgi:hypothetical protein
MIKPSSIEPDVELRDFLQALNIHVETVNGSQEKVDVYGDWERSTNDLPADFIVVYKNGTIGGVGMDVDYASGYIMVSLYSKMNDDGSVKKNRTKKLLSQIDEIFIERITDPETNQVTEHYKNLVTDKYVYKYDAQRFITPTTPNQTSGYSVTTLNLMWHTKNNFNSE